MTPIRLVATVTAVVFTLCSAPAAGARGAQNPSLQGTWTLDRDASDDLNETIENTVAGLNLIVRQVLRPRLRSTNPSSPQYVIRFDAQNVRIDEMGRPSANFPADGSFVLWHRETGRPCQQMRIDCVGLSAAFPSEALELTLQAEDFRQVKRFSTDGNSLTMAVTITSPRLPQPMRYKQVYRRAN